MLQRYMLERKVMFLLRIGANRILFDDLVMKSEAMQVLVHEAKKAAGNDRPLLIIGEAGTGRESLAGLSITQAVGGMGLLSISGVPIIWTRCFLPETGWMN